MSQDTNLVVTTRKLPAPVETRMSELFSNLRLAPEDKVMGHDDLVAAVKEAVVLVPTVTEKVDRAVIEAAGDQLKLIANYGNGVDNIDLTAARERGIVVTNTPGVLAEDTADIAMALILTAPRRVSEGEKLLADGHWKGWSTTGLLGQRLAGKTLGILGMGRIGTAVARRAKAFGLDVVYHNRNRLPEDMEEALGATFCPTFEYMLTQTDILSIHCPLTERTHQCVNEERLALIKDGAFIVNTARGEVIDETALVAALESGKLAGAGLDVFAHEPEIHPALLTMKNVTLLPHLASNTLEGHIEMGEKVIINIKTFIDGHRPPDRCLDLLWM